MGKKESEQTDKEQIFQSESVWKSIIMMSLPAMVSVIVMLLYNIADMYFVGLTKDLSMVASVSLSMPVFTILMGISTMLGNGGCAIIARAMGEGEKRKMSLCFSLCVWAAILIGIAAAVLTVFFLKPLITMLGANEQMWEHTRDYVMVLSLGAPIVLLNGTICTLLRGEGAIKTGLIGNVLSTLVNVALDPLLILGFGMGVGGAAAATVIGNGAGILYYLLYKRKNNTCMTLRPIFKRKDLALLGSMMALGLPNAVSSCLSGLASTFSNRILVQYGTGPVASMGAASKTVMVISLLQMAVCMGVQPLLSYNYGAGKIRRLREASRKLALMTLGLGLVMGAGCYAGREGIVRMFIKDAGAATLGGHLVSCLIWSMPFLGLYYVSMNFLQSTGRALAANILSILRQGVLLIPLLYLLNMWIPLDGVAYAHVGADGLAIIIGLCMALTVSWRIKKRGQLQEQ